jgi:hypothetical protein
VGRRRKNLYLVYQRVSNISTSVHGRRSWNRRLLLSCGTWPSEVEWRRIPCRDRHRATPQGDGRFAAPATARIGVNTTVATCGDRVGLSWLALVCQTGTFTECLRNVPGWASRNLLHVTVSPTGSLG